MIHIEKQYKIYIYMIHIKKKIYIFINYKIYQVYVCVFIRLLYSTKTIKTLLIIIYLMILLLYN